MPSVHALNLSDMCSFLSLLLAIFVQIWVKNKVFLAENLHVSFLFHKFAGDIELILLYT